jgi:hypothetical protein
MTYTVVAIIEVMIVVMIVVLVILMLMTRVNELLKEFIDGPIR